MAQRLHGLIDYWPNSVWRRLVVVVRPRLYQRVGWRTLVVLADASLLPMSLSIRGLGTPGWQ